VRSGAHVDPLTRHSPALRSTGRIRENNLVFSVVLLLLLYYCFFFLVYTAVDCFDPATPSLVLSLILMVFLLETI